MSFRTSTAEPPSSTPFLPHTEAAVFLINALKPLSTDAKLLYGMLIDRMELSMKNGWTDKTGGCLSTSHWRTQGNG